MSLDLANRREALSFDVTKYLWTWPITGKLSVLRSLNVFGLGQSTGSSQFCVQVTDKMDVDYNKTLKNQQQQQQQIPRAQELCESRCGRSGLPSLISLLFLWM